MNGMLLSIDCTYSASTTSAGTHTPMECVQLSRKCRSVDEVFFSSGEAGQCVM